MRRIAYILSLLTAMFMLPALAKAESKASRVDHPHQLRIGIGEGLLSPMPYYCDCADYLTHSPGLGMSVPDAHQMLNSAYYERIQTTHVPHFFLDYQYRVNSWFGVGVQTDWTGASSCYRQVNGYGDLLGDARAHEIEWTLVPTAHFTFLHRDWVNLYAGGGIGYSLLVGKDCEGDSYDYHSPAYLITPIGLSVGKNQWFGSAELGMLIQPAFGHLLERFCTLSVGYRF